MSHPLDKIIEEHKDEIAAAIKDGEERIAAGERPLSLDQIIEDARKDNV